MARFYLQERNEQRIRDSCRKPNQPSMGAVRKPVCSGPGVRDLVYHMNTDKDFSLRVIELAVNCFQPISL